MDFEVGGSGIDLNGQRGDQFMAMIERVFQVGGQLIDHIGGDLRVNGNFGGDAVEGVEEEMRVELESDELEFHGLNFGTSFGLKGGLCLGVKFSLQPEIGKSPREINKPHENGEDDPTFPDGKMNRSTGWGVEQIEAREKRLHEGGVESCSDGSKQDGQKNKGGAENALKARSFVNVAQESGEEKADGLRGKSHLNSTRQVFLHDEADEKSEQTKATPKEKVDPPKPEWIKKLSAKGFKHWVRLGEKEAGSTREKTLNRAKRLVFF